MKDGINRQDVAPYITKDSSEIREFINPAMTKDCRNLSLAEATLKPGTSTQKHIHPKSEEVYYFLSGSGRMTIGEREFTVNTGDAVFIAAGAAHQCFNESVGDMRILCHCAPAYSHEDTTLCD